MCLPVKPFKIELEWKHAGLKCAVVMNREQGHRCGYVRVPPTHSTHGMDYNDVNVSVHGGLTFGQPEPCVEEDGVGFWFGFDCNHSGDIGVNPNVPKDYVWNSEDERRSYEILKDLTYGEAYRSFEYVKVETEQLAEQFAKL